MDNEGQSAGDVLRKAREGKNLTLDQANRATKITPEVIRALEQDDHGSFASDIYLKGFLKNYAAYLGLDAAQVWSLVTRKRSDTPDAAGTFWDIEETVHEERLKSPRIFRRFLLPVLLVAIVVLALLLVRTRRQMNELQTGDASPHVEPGVVSLVTPL